MTAKAKHTARVIVLEPGGIVARRWGCTCPKARFAALGPEAAAFAVLCRLHGAHRRQRARRKPRTA